MAIIGGAVLTGLMGFVSDVTGHIRFAMFVPLACFVVVAYLSGMRTGEVLNLERGCLQHDPTTGLWSITGRFTMNRALLESWNGLTNPDLLRNRNNGWLMWIALVKPGVTREQGQGRHVIDRNGEEALDLPGV